MKASRQLGAKADEVKQLAGSGMTGEQIAKTLSIGVVSVLRALRA